MRLRQVHRCDFRRSEVTNCNDLARTMGATAPGEVVLLRSFSGDQLRFVFRAEEVEQTGKDGRARTRTVWRSYHLRLDGGTWDPLLLAHYAERAGIRLDNQRLYRIAERHLKAVA
jgi:hypothetical protein